MRKKLSVVVLTKNVENKIKNCLESVKWADEIVIVDGFSTDKTLGICKRYNTKIIQHRFEGDFGQERNIGIDNSSGDWILQLDADEVVTEGMRSELDKIANEDREFVAYKFLRKNFFMGHFMRYGGWYHYSLHLFRKGFARYQGKVHHDLIVNGKIGVINAEVEHYPFDNFSQFIERQNRYTDLEAREIIDLKRYINEKNILYNVRVKPVKLFWKFYVKKKGFKEGTHGFIFSVLFAWVHFLKWTKVWELAKDKKNILVIRNDRFGEFLLNIPAMRALKEKFPDSKIILAVDPYVKELALKIPYADEVIEWKNGAHSLIDIFKFAKLLGSKEIDISVVMNPSKDSNIAIRLAGIPERVGYARKWDFLLTKKIKDLKYIGDRHEVEYNIDLVKLIGAQIDDKSISLEIDEAEFHRRGVLSDNINSTAAVGLIAIHPWTSDPIKQWPPERFRELSLKLAKEFDADILIIGGKDEAERSGSYNYLNKRIYNMTGKTSLVELAALLKRCAMLISGDSGPVHLASSVGTPVIALFRDDIPGKSPKRWGPWGKGNVVIAKKNLLDISVEEVFEKAKILISGPHCHCEEPKATTQSK